MPGAIFHAEARSSRTIWKVNDRLDTLVGKAFTNVCAVASTRNFSSGARKICRPAPAVHAVTAKPMSTGIDRHRCFMAELHEALSQPPVSSTTHNLANRFQGGCPCTAQVLRLHPGNSITRHLHSLLGEASDLHSVSHGAERLPLHQIVLANQHEIASSLQESNARLARRGALRNPPHQEVVADDQAVETHLRPQ